MAVRGVAVVVLAEHLLADIEAPLEEGARRCGVASRIQQGPEVEELHRGVGAAGVGSLRGCEGAAKQRLSAREISCLLERDGEVVDGDEGVRMIGAELGLAGGEDLLAHRDGCGRISAQVDRQGEMAHRGERVERIGARELPACLYELLEDLLGWYEVSGV
jgi:hypothetical protein